MGYATIHEKRQRRVDDSPDRTHLATIRRRSRRHPEVGAEQLICTIEHVEQHDTDPTPDPADPWSEAGKRWSSIGEKLRDRYKEVSGDGGPSEDEVRSALETLGQAARAVADSVGNAMKDPDVREQAKHAAASFVTALGQTFSQLGDELRNAREQEAEPPDEG